MGHFPRWQWPALRVRPAAAGGGWHGVAGEDGVPECECAAEECPVSGIVLVEEVHDDSAARIRRPQLPQAGLVGDPFAGGQVGQGCRGHSLRGQPLGGEEGGADARSAGTVRVGLGRDFAAWLRQRSINPSTRSIWRADVLLMWQWCMCAPVSLAARTISSAPSIRVAAWSRPGRGSG